jgi:hypothetical protein
MDKFVPSWHDFKNSVAVEIGLLHSHQFTYSHFHFIVIVESATSHVLLQMLEQTEVQRARSGQHGYRTIGQ